MSDDALTIVPDECDLGVKQWRGMASAIAELRGKAVWWATALQLENLPSTFRVSLSEFEEETNLSADVLEAIAQRSREADDFDGSYESLGANAGLIDRLTASLNDGKGAAWSYYLDPQPANGDSEHTVHMGYLPLWGENGPQMADVRQADLGSCVLLATVAGLAATDPAHVQSLITDNGDGTYTVLIDGEAVTVDDEMVASDGNVRYAQNTNVLWPMILEKAWAARYGHEYDSAVGGDPVTVAEALGYESDSMTFFGLQSEFENELGPTASEVEQAMWRAQESGGTMIVTATGALGMNPGVDGHAWTVVSMETIDGEVWVTVRNPWGEPGIREPSEGEWQYNAGNASGANADILLEGADGREDVPVYDIASGDDAPAESNVQVVSKDAGTVSMRLDVFLANFDKVVISTGPAG